MSTGRLYIMDTQYRKFSTDNGSNAMIMVSQLLR